MDAHIRADRGRAWTAIVFVGVRFLVVCSALMSAAFVSGELSREELAVGFANLAVVLTLITGVPMALGWWFWPSGVSYRVTEGELRVCRGTRIVRRHPCIDITSLSLTGSLGWRELTVRNWVNAGIDGWPELEVGRDSWPSPRLLVGPRRQPSILLWGTDRCAQVQEELRHAVTAHGAVLSEEP